MKKLVFNFKSKDTKKIKIAANILGGKGANLAEMGRLGYPVPSGFTISTEVCDLFYKNNNKISPNILKQIKTEIKNIEKDSGKKFGDLKNPLLVSVRSGARVSMPGMMDTILNLGLNDRTVLSFRPKFNIVSIIPGIEILAPDLTETSKGFFKSPNLLPDSFSIFFISAFIFFNIFGPIFLLFL